MVRLVIWDAIVLIMTSLWYITTTAVAAVVAVVAAALIVVLLVLMVVPTLFTKVITDNNITIITYQNIQRNGLTRDLFKQLSRIWRSAFEFCYFFFNFCMIFPITIDLSLMNSMRTRPNFNPRKVLKSTIINVAWRFYFFKIIFHAVWAFQTFTGWIHHFSFIWFDWLDLTRHISLHICCNKDF